MKKTAKQILNEIVKKYGPAIEKLGGTWSLETNADCRLEMYVPHKKPTK